MTSKFWWKLRKIWHSPSSMIQTHKPNTFINYCNIVEEWYINPMYHIRLQKKDYSGVYRMFKCDFKNLLIIIKREFMWFQPFRCNGNNGGWRTDVCEWLENKARYYEEIEDEKLK